MQPTLRDGQFVLVRPGGRGVLVGDVVVFTTGDGERRVKRVAAGPDDLVELEAGRLYVNGRSYDGHPRTAGPWVETWRVPERHVFVVGDDLRRSDDSRVWREPYVPVERISGVVMLRRSRARKTASPGSIAPVGFTRGHPDRTAADRHRDPAQRSP